MSRRAPQGAMAGHGRGDGLQYHSALYLDPALVLVLLIAAVGSMPVVPLLEQWREHTDLPSLRWTADVASTAVLATVLLVSCMALAAGTYNPFIYYRF